MNRQRFKITCGWLILHVLKHFQSNENTHMIYQFPAWPIQRIDAIATLSTLLSSEKVKRIKINPSCCHYCIIFPLSVWKPTDYSHKQGGASSAFTKDGKNVK